MAKHSSEIQHAERAALARTSCKSAGLEVRRTFEQDFSAWETVKVKYETLTGTSLPDGVLIAKLLNKISGPLQQHLTQAVR